MCKSNVDLGDILRHWIWDVIKWPWRDQKSPVDTTWNTRHILPVDWNRKEGIVAQDFWLLLTSCWGLLFLGLKRNNHKSGRKNGNEKQCRWHESNSWKVQEGKTNVPVDYPLRARTNVLVVNKSGDATIAEQMKRQTKNGRPAWLTPSSWPTLLT
jgi:hypothetical protein